MKHQLIGGVGLVADAVAKDLAISLCARHVPVTRDLAHGLAQLMTDRAPVQHSRWGRAFALMTRAVGSSGAFASQQLLRGVMDRFVLTVVEPVLRQAAVRADLAASDLLRAAIPREVADALETAVDALLSDMDGMGQAFWLASALDLAGNGADLAQRSARLRETIEPYEIDRQLAAITFLHPPVFSEAHKTRTLRQRKVQNAAQKRAGLRPKEGGVAGIIQSRNYDDLPDALFSELILPKALLANKLMQDGLLTRHRPPYRSPKRDLLALTLLDVPTSDDTGRFVKALWADAAIRLRIAIWQRGLANSDLVWADQSRSSMLDCQIDTPGLERFPPLKLEGKSRVDALMRTRLFPDHARFGSLAPQEAKGLSALVRRGLTPLAERLKRDRTQLAADYARRFALICRPHLRAAPPDWAELRPQLKAELAPVLRASTIAALYWQPQQRRLYGFAEHHEPLELDLPTSLETLPEISGELIHWMMDVTLEAIDVAQA